MKAAVILVSFNGAPWLEQCLQTLLIQDPLPALIAVDNGSSDSSVEIIRDFIEANPALSAELLSLETNTGFTRGANRGLQEALQGRPEIEAFFLLNQDAWMEKNCLEAFTTLLEEDAEAGILGARILYPDGLHIQHAGAFLKAPRMVGLHYGHHERERPGVFQKIREVDFVTGAAMMIRRRCLEEIGLFKEIFSPGYYEDVDLCRRAREKNWKILYIPSARIRHHESASFTNRDLRLRLAQRNRLIFLLDRLQEKDFRSLFEKAEKDYIEEEATMDELIAVSGASLEVLARLRPIEEAMGMHLNADERSQLVQLLASLRRSCRRAIRTRIAREGS